MFLFEGVFSGSCKGDSGGPLQIADPDNEGRRTLVGVVSGGAGCGQGVPGWYSKVSFHIDWISCIIDMSVQFNNNQEKVMEACMDTIKSEPTCVEEKDLVVGLEYEEMRNEIKKYQLELCQDISGNNF